MNELIKNVAEAIDNNDNYTPIRLIVEFMGWNPDALYKLDCIERDHERKGHLTPLLRIERDEVKEWIEGHFIAKYGEKNWIKLRF